LDPITTKGTEHLTSVANSVRDTLTVPLPNGDVAPGLAESWESGDGIDWVFRLRKGVEFHNGKTLTASDAVWSLRRPGSEKSQYVEGKTIVSSFESIEAEDATTVRIKLKDVNHDLPIYLAGHGMLIGMEGTSDWNAPGHGTGPYMIEEYEPGVRFIGKRAPNFYRDDEGWFDSVEIINVADAATRTNALLAGSADVVGAPETKTAQRIAKVPGLALKVVPSGWHVNTVMRCDTAPFDSNDMRLAIKYGIRRQEIVDKVYLGLGYVGNDHPVPRGNKFFNDQLPQREFDADKARFHAKKAGYDGSALQLIASEGAVEGSVDFCTLMQASLKEAGINIQVKSVPGDGYYSDVWRKVPWCSVDRNPRPTADYLFAIQYVSSATQKNDSAFSNEEFNRLHAAARRERDEGKRRDMYHEMQRIARDEGGNTSFAFLSFLIGSTDKMGHGELGTSRSNDDGRIPRRWWFAAA
jgi:peptide/nickel transport system substrate-binding protein